MGRDELRAQRSLIDGALSSADSHTLRETLDGTIGDARSFCWATLRQFRRRASYNNLGTPEDYGLQHVETHMLLVVAHDTVAHVEIVEDLLARLGDPRQLQPDSVARDALREARNLLAVHRDRRVLYWRLTGEHTPHVHERYGSLGILLPESTIDFEIIGYSPPPDASQAEIDRGYASVGTLGGLLSLQELHSAFVQLDGELTGLSEEYR